MPEQALPVERNASWLAMTFGCCASRRDSFDGIEDERSIPRSREEVQMQICYDQPKLVPQPWVESPSRPLTGHSMTRHVSQWVSSSREFATRASSRASLHTVSKPRKSFAKVRPLIGLPTNFRRCDGIDIVDVQNMVDDAAMPIRRRRHFSPLELSIYLPDGRLSPLPDFAESEWNRLQMPSQAVVRDRTSVASTDSNFKIQRKPVGSSSRPSSYHSQNTNTSRPVSGAFATMPLLQEETITANRSASPAKPLRRSSTQASPASSRVLSRLPSPSRGRSNTAPARPASLRKAKSDVDEAIRELNTIVEERRADAYRTKVHAPWLINKPPPSPSHHVPAIAPSLRMHVRSETLSDIGSAFSVPLANKPLPNTPAAASPLTKSSAAKLPSLQSLRTMTSGPLNSNPVTPPTVTPTTPIHRLGAWIKRSMPTTPATPLFRSGATTPKSSLPISAPFYSCEQQQTPYIPSILPQHPQPPYSRPSTSASTLNPTHTRQESAETATATLFSEPRSHPSSASSTSSRPSTPSLAGRTSRSSSYSSCDTKTASPPTPATAFTSAAFNNTNAITNMHTDVDASKRSHSQALGTQKAGLVAGAKAKSPKRKPAPLILCKEIEIEVESPPETGRSSLSSAVDSAGERPRMLRPPQSPNYGLLAGLEMTAREGDGMRGERMSSVGVAF